MLAAIAALTLVIGASSRASLAQTSGSDDSLQRIGNWRGKITVDPMTDKKDALFLVLAEGADEVDPAGLSIRCQAGQLDVVVHAGVFLGDKADYRVTVRFGTTPAEQETWISSASNTAVFVGGKQKDVAAFAQRLAGFDKFAIELTPYQRAPHAFVFDITGVKDVVATLAPICPA